MLDITKVWSMFTWKRHSHGAGHSRGREYIDRDDRLFRVGHTVASLHRPLSLYILPSAVILTLQLNILNLDNFITY